MRNFTQIQLIIAEMESLLEHPVTNEIQITILIHELMGLCDSIDSDLAQRFHYANDIRATS